MIRVLHGDCLELLPTLKDLDACVCDPPYHLTSGNAVYDFDLTGAGNQRLRRHTRGGGFMGKQWDGGDIAFNVDTWRLVYDTLKPGAYILAFSSCRTYHHMAMAIEAAGFITHPFLAWIFGSGFPKSTRLNVPGTEGWRYGGQALKPAIEPIYMGQKPMEGTGTQNWLKHGTGAINIDACRVEANDAPEGRTRHGGGRAFAEGVCGFKQDAITTAPAGRWPANVLHSGDDEVEAAFAAFGEGHARGNKSPTKCRGNSTFGLGERGAETAINPGDTGTASRFYYAAKASKADRAGSKHPTIKPQSLMRWLCRLVTPPGGTILDCFAGSGSTGAAAMREGFNAVLIEREAEYVADIQRRIEQVEAEATTIITKAQMDMFA